MLFDSVRVLMLGELILGNWFAYEILNHGLLNNCNLAKECATVNGLSGSVYLGLKPFFA